MNTESNRIEPICLPSIPAKPAPRAALRPPIQSNSATPQAQLKSFIIKFFHDQMQKQINIDPQRPFKEIDKLRVVKLRLQQIVQRDLGIRAGDHHIATRSVDHEYADLVAGDGEIDAIPLPLGVSAPVDQDAAVGEIARRVLV